MPLHFAHDGRGSAERFHDSPEPGHDSGTPLNGKRVLVVEDSYLAAKSIVQALEHLGCQVIGPAPGVREALPLIESKPIDLAVLDINLSQGETSEHLAIELTKRHVPFIFVSGYASPVHLSERFHATPRVRKPVLESTLLSALLQEIRRAEE